MKPRVVVAVTARAALDVVVGHIDHLHSCGWDVHVVVGEETPELLFPKARLHVLPMRRGISRSADLVAMRRWWSLLRELCPDIVVAATPKAAFLGLTAAKAVGVRHRVWWAWGLRSDGDAGSSVRWAERVTAAAATSIVAASPSLASSLATITRTEAAVLGQGAIAGVDLDVFIPPTRRTTSRTAVYVGRLAEDKGMSELVTIWPSVAARVPGAELHIAGRPDDLDPPGPAWAKFTTRPDVRLLGWVDDVPGLLQAAKVLLLPSAREGMPAVVLEAAACAVPTVTWDVTGSRDAVVHGVTGYLCARGDYELFTSRTVELLSDPNVAQCLGAAANANVSANFDRHMVEGLFQEFLANLVAAPPTGAVEGTEELEVVDLTKTQADSQSPVTTSRR